MTASGFRLVVPVRWSGIFLDLRPTVDPSPVAADKKRS
jgi:hypothetical protein